MFGLSTYLTWTTQPVWFCDIDRIVMFRLLHPNGCQYEISLYFYFQVSKYLFPVQYERL